MRDDEVVREAGDGFLPVGKARISHVGHDITTRVSHGGMRCVGGHVKGVVCASLCVEATERAFLQPDDFENTFENLHFVARARVSAP